MKNSLSNVLFCLPAHFNGAINCCYIISLRSLSSNRNKPIKRKKSTTYLGITHKICGGSSYFLRNLSINEILKSIPKNSLAASRSIVRVLDITCAFRLGGNS